MDRDPGDIIRRFNIIKKSVRTNLTAHLSTVPQPQCPMPLNPQQPSAPYNHHQAGAHNHAPRIAQSAPQPLTNPNVLPPYVSLQTPLTNPTMASSSSIYASQAPQQPYSFPHSSTFLLHQYIAQTRPMVTQPQMPIPGPHIVSPITSTQPPLNYAQAPSSVTTNDSIPAAAVPAAAQSIPFHTTHSGPTPQHKVKRK